MGIYGHRGIPLTKVQYFVISFNKLLNNGADVQLVIWDSMTLMRSHFWSTA